MIEIIRPTWQAPERIHAGTSARSGGFSKAPFDSLNLGMHVKDNPDAVAQNRLALTQTLNGSEPLWLTQSHGDIVYQDTGENPSSPPNADASITTLPNRVLAILTADCVPILLAHTNGLAVAAIHAGWRGLANNIIPNTLHALPGQISDYIAWIGPCVNQDAYLVNHEFQNKLCAYQPAYATAFRETENGPKADLPAMAETALRLAGIQSVTQSGLCTYQDDRFFSYRQNPQSGRIATLIWMS